MEAVCSSETSVKFYRSIQCYIPEDSAIHSHQCEKNIHYLYHLLFCTVELTSHIARQINYFVSEHA
jgi:hypothetical protein